MSLGPENFNLTIQLDSLFCFIGGDSTGESEPYMWTYMVKIDAEGFSQNGNFLGGEAIYFIGPGNPGNLGSSILSDFSIPIPENVGKWDTNLRPIPISVAGQQITEIPGIIICGVALLEENWTPNDKILGAHDEITRLVKTTVAETIASLGLAGIAADAAVLFGQNEAAGTPISIEAAVATIAQLRLKPITDLFSIAAAGDAVVTILQSLKGTEFFSALNPDAFNGTFSQVFIQPDLAQTSEENAIDINQKLWHIPDYAYDLHGYAVAHHRFDAPTASGNNLQVTASGKRTTLGGKRITSISGDENGVVWVYGRETAAGYILRGEKSFFVLGPGTRKVDVLVGVGGYANGQPWHYLHTQADDVKSNNLLELPDIPTDVILGREVWY